MRAGIEDPETENFDILPRSFTMILFTTFTLVKRIGFRPLTFFRILSKSWDFWSRFCI